MVTISRKNSLTQRTLRFTGAACLGVLLVGPGLATAQTAKKADAKAKSTETWRDKVDANDVRYVGTVARVMDNRFELRTADHGVMEFAIPTDADYSTAVFTGNKVQVWVNGGSVSFLESYGEVVADGTKKGTMDKNAMDTKKGTMDKDMDHSKMAMDKDTMDKNNVKGDMSADRKGDTYKADARAGVDLDADREDEASMELSAKVDTKENTAKVNSQTRTAQDEPNANSTTARTTTTTASNSSWNENTLPRTGSLVPAAAGLGFLLLLAGAALRRF